MPAPDRLYTRVAVAQLDFQPAALPDRRSPMEDPLFAPGKPDSLLPVGRLPSAYRPRLRELRGRIRAAYLTQLRERVRAVIDACLTWKVRLLLLPEYSLPWELLVEVAEVGQDMVIVAGTHAVDRAARTSGVYERLSCEPPPLGQAVCPILHRQQALALQPKLNASVYEPNLKRGQSWSPVQLPPPVPGPLGLLVCLDFLWREGAQHHELVAATLEDCRFLAVPSLTPFHTVREFQAHAWEEARRYGRPVLYADGSRGGGSSVFVDEGRVHDLRGFPKHAGLLDQGDEGLIVADVDLGYVRTGRSTRFDQVPLRSNPLQRPPWSTARVPSTRPSGPLRNASLAISQI